MLYVVGMASHDKELAHAFDGQAARFERAPVQSDPVALARLVQFAALPGDSRVLDAGCGPGLVSEAFLLAGHRVHGVDLSPEMLSRARAKAAGLAVTLIEGFWSTGAGLRATEAEVLVSGHGRTSVVRPLVDAAYWGKQITDERYLLVST